MGADLLIRLRDGTSTVQAVSDFLRDAGEGRLASGQPAAAKRRNPFDHCYLPGYAGNRITLAMVATMSRTWAVTCPRRSHLSNSVRMMVVLSGLAVPMAGDAQTIRGAVHQLEDRRPLGDVLIRVTGDRGFEVTTLSDSSGRFTVIVPGEGRYLVGAERTDLQPFASAMVKVPARGAVEITLTMSSEAVQLEGLMVVATRRDLSMTAMINERIRSTRALGRGHTLTLEEIEARGAPHTAALVRMAGPGVTIDERALNRPDADVLRLQNCVPAVYVDGVQINHTPYNVNYLVAPDELIAVEVYRGASQMRDYFDSNGCGTILLWTRRGTEEHAGRVSWKRVGIAVLLVIGLLILR